MKSIFLPEKSYGNRFFRTTYAKVARKLKIDPIAEGALLRKRINRLLWGDDLYKLADEEERKRRLILANQYAEAYRKRFKKFMKVYYRYCYAAGGLRAVRTFEKFLPSGEKKVEQMEEKQQKVLEK